MILNLALLFVGAVWVDASELLDRPLLVGVAQAQDDSAAMAESLFQAGRTEMEAGRYEAACAKFAESNRLEPSGGTLLNLGKCQEALGNSATAWAAYKQAEVVGRAKGQTRHVEAAEKFIAEIEPKLSKLTILAPDPVKDMKITRGDVEMSGASLGVPFAVDPGTYPITATAEGYRPFKGTVTIGPNGDKRTVTISRLEKDPGGAPLPAPTLPIDDQTTDPPPDPQPKPNKEESGLPDTLMTTGLVFGGVAIAGAVVGTIFGLLAIDDASVAEENGDLCPNKECTQAGLDHVDSGKTKALVSNIGFIAGGASAAIAVGLIVTSFAIDAPPSDETAQNLTPRLNLFPMVGPESSGLVIEGSF